MRKIKVSHFTHTQYNGSFLTKPSTTEGDANEAATRRLAALLGGSVPSGRHALGFIDEISPTDFDRFVAFFLNQSHFNFTGLVFQTPTSNPTGIGDRLRDSLGVMLFRPVPEPSTASTALFCLVFLMLTVRQSFRIPPPIP